MKLRVDPQALEELERAEEFTVQNFGEFVADEFRIAVANALEEIADFPKRYAEIDDGIRAKVLDPYPYSIVYEVHNDTVRDCAPQTPAWLLEEAGIIPRGGGCPLGALCCPLSYLASDFIPLLQQREGLGEGIT